jgi:hypothetical protein
MSRIRTIKPEFFTSADITSLTPLSRLFYVSLWCEADREGRLKWDTRTLKNRYFPVEQCSIDELAQELTDAGLIVIYEVDGKQYAEIPSFKDHQVINNREAESVLPARVKEACTRVLGEGKEGRKGKEGASCNAINDSSPKTKRETPIPKDFSVSEAVRSWAASKGYDRLDEHLEHFVGACKAKGYKYSDWDQAFQNAIRKNWAGLPAPGNVSSIFAGAI